MRAGIALAAEARVDAILLLAVCRATVDLSIVLLVMMGLRGFGSDAIDAPRWPAFSGATTQGPAFREASPVFPVEPYRCPPSRAPMRASAVKSSRFWGTGRNMEFVTSFSLPSRNRGNARSPCPPNITGSSRKTHLPRLPGPFSSVSSTISKRIVDRSMPHRLIA